MTIPVDFYFTYIPQKTGAKWNYKDKICQSNRTMCSSGGGGGGGAIAGIVIGIIFGSICMFVIWKMVLKPMFCPPKPEMELVEVIDKPAHVEEVMVDAGEHTVS